MQTHMKRFIVTIGLFTVFSLGASHPGFAQTAEDSTPSEVAVATNAAVADAGAPASTGAAAVTDTAAGVATSLPGSTVSMVIPAADVDGATRSSTVVDGAGSSQAAVQQVGNDGKRVAFIINAVTDPTRYELNFAGAASLQAAEDGSILVIDANGDVASVVAAPWAKDANGTDVPTRYEINGTRLTQIVDHTSGTYVYPLTADPYARHWWGLSVYLNRRQTNNVMFGAAAAAAASLYIPEPAVSKAVAASLGLFTGYAGWAYNRGACLAFHRAWTGQVWAWHYYHGSCR